MHYRIYLYRIRAKRLSKTIHQLSFNDKSNIVAVFGALKSTLNFTWSCIIKANQFSTIH